MIENFIVKENNVIDYDQSLAKFKAALDSYIELNSNLDSKIENLANSLFNKNKVIKKTVLVDTIACDLCHEDSTKFKEIQSAVNSWLTNNIGNKEEKALCFKKGPGGGVSRWKDM